LLVVIWNWNEKYVLLNCKYAAVRWVAAQTRDMNRHSLDYKMKTLPVSYGAKSACHHDKK